MELTPTIDNRDANRTWLRFEENDDYTELTVEDMFDLIENVIANNPGMDLSFIEERAERLKLIVYGKIEV